MNVSSRTSVVALVAACVAVAGCKAEQKYDKPPTAVKTTTVQTYSPSNTLRYAATIRPVTQVTLAFRVGGYVDQIYKVGAGDGRGRDVQEGDRVSKGTVLARVREGDYAARVAQAKSQLAEAQAGVDHAKLEFERARNLFSTQSITKADMDGAQAKLDAVQAKLAGAAAQVDQAEIALRDCALAAPMDATVVKKLVEVGTLVAPGAPAFAVADTTTVLAVIGVPDFAVKSFSTGQSLPVTSEALPGVDFRGRITRIAPTADLASRIFEIELSLANPDNRLKPGMIASVEVRDSEGAQPTIAVPLAAVVRSTKNPEAYAVCTVQNENGHQVARFREVKLGLPVGNMVAVVEGLQTGDRVVVEGATLAAEGEQIRVIP